ncbi:MAG: DUF6443 domain-containing protein, partial [Candidatus Symbiothrix sp.]|nr:DUF6443 domain-containing protein [Candidatus Symbiothrix sp.]
MKLKNIPTIILLFAINELLLCQSYDQNYITTRTMLNATGTSAIETVRYFDGLGRLVETVAKGITPDGQDLVSYQTYDACGRDDKAYLPRKAAQNSGNYMEFSTFNALPKNIYQYDEKPYAQTVYEPSPLNRVVEQYGAGADWYAHSKSIKTAYLSNNGSNSCAYYYVSGDNLVKNGNYASNQLYVTQIADEDGNTTLEFKDKQGKIVLTRRCSDWADTYYVYDDEDNLRFVLSPEAADQLTANTTFNAETNTALKTLAYIYRYDYRKRCVYKRLPGCDPIYYVYDKSDRLIFSQDGEQRLKALWQFFIPDIFGRTVLTGYCQKLNNTAPAVGLYDQQLITASAFSASGAYKGYNILIDGAAKTLTTYTLTTAYYFDNYNFMGTFDIPNTAEMQYETGYAIQHSSAQGLLTGSWVAQGNNSAG